MSEWDWEGLADWWVDELSSDPAYDDVVTPLVMRLLGPVDGRLVLDLGCGEGRLMRTVAAAGGRPVGIDFDQTLLGLAADCGQAVRSTLVHLPFGDDLFDGALISLVLEHLIDHRWVLAEATRVLTLDAPLALVMNHPTFTAPHSAPIADVDGETLWRPGRYFGAGYTEEPAGPGTIRFHHRSMGTLLTDAAQVGLCLEEMIELGPDPSQIERMPSLGDQLHIPRLLGVRWRKTSGGV